MPARIHDLLEIDAERFLQAQPAVPQWVTANLRQTPFIVVRRGSISAQEIPVGVRGARRNERWAATCRSDIVGSILTPQDLLRRMTIGSSGVTSSIPHPTSHRLAAAPALHSLSLLAQRWHALALLWGPGGSVGFELATGRPVVRPDSDLDVVIYAASPMTQAEARHLRDNAQALPTPVDIRVETPYCGFSLTEFASRAPAPILLRLPSGTALGTDPWTAP